MCHKNTYDADTGHKQLTTEASFTGGKPNIRQHGAGGDFSGCTFPKL